MKEEILFSPFFTWGVVLWDDDNSKPDYVGFHPEKEAHMSDKGWLVFKIFYKGNSSNVQKIMRAEGRWNDRSVMFPAA